MSEAAEPSAPPADLEAAKLAALAEFAAGAGHEINNPVAVISGRAQLLLAGETDPERRRELVTIHRQALRIREMISDLMHFARPARPRFDLVDLREVLAGLLERQAARARAARVELAWQPPPDPLLVQADRNQLAIALAAVVENALDALEAHPPADTPGRVTLTSTAAIDPATGARSARIDVADNGPGFGPDIRRHLFDPYFSGRSAGRGIGLGLSKSWRIVELHGGRIEVASEEGKGVTLSLILPASEAAGPA